MRQKVRTIMEKIAVKEAKAHANTTCSWLTYQPKESEAIKKLRKK